MPTNDKPITRALRHRANIEEAGPSVTPLYQNSAFNAGSEYFYTRNDNPNVREFEEAIAILEGAENGLAVSTGMMAITMVAGLVRTDQTVVVHKHTYGCSLKHLQRLSDRGRFKLLIVDLINPDELEHLDIDCGLVLFETPTNPFLYTVNISNVVNVVRDRWPDALVAVDNTWATPLFQRPLANGADISLHSATKYLSGHSDVMGGVILTDRNDLAKELRDDRFYSGSILDPHSAWLLRRSIQTLKLRMDAHAKTAREMVKFLETRPEVGKLYYPDIDEQQLKDYGCIIFFSFAEGYRGNYPAFLGNLRLFQSGTGMACVSSMVAQPYTGSHASLDDAAKASMGLDRDLVRLCFGLEDADDLKSDIASALDELHR
jgi:cystathionine beta-lyase/cystathionine gamma-synthase